MEAQVPAHSYYRTAQTGGNGQEDTVLSAPSNGDRILVARNRNPASTRPALWSERHDRRCCINSQMRLDPSRSYLRRLTEQMAAAELPATVGGDAAVAR